MKVATLKNAPQHSRSCTATPLLTNMPHLLRFPRQLSTPTCRTDRQEDVHTSLEHMLSIVNACSFQILTLALKNCNIKPDDLSSALCSADEGRAWLKVVKIRHFHVATASVVLLQMRALQSDAVPYPLLSIIFCVPCVSKLEFIRLLLNSCPSSSLCVGSFPRSTTIASHNNSTIFIVLKVSLLLLLRCPLPLFPHGVQLTPISKHLIAQN